MLTRRARDVEPEQIINSLEEGIRQTVHNEFSLLSLSCSDYLSLSSVELKTINPSSREKYFLEDGLIVLTKSRHHCSNFIS